jgi:hypothetical protein
MGLWLLKVQASPFQRPLSTNMAACRAISLSHCCGPSTSKAATDDGNFLFSVKGKEMKRKRKRKPELKLSKEGDRLV